MSREFAAGVLGVGNIGGIHLRSLTAIDGVTVEAVADVDGDNRSAARERTGCRTYDDYEQLLEKEELDIVVVALPPFLHADATIQAAESGTNVFVEKPFARTTNEAELMVKAAENNDVYLGVDHTIRYHPEVREMKRLYDEGRLGHVPLSFISRINNGPFSSPPDRSQVPGWKVSRERSGGGSVLTLGVHLLDVLEWFFGELTVEYAHLESQFDVPIEDAALVVLRASETETMAILTCGAFQWESLPDVNMWFRLEGTTGYLEDRAFVPDSLELHAAKSMIKNVLRRGLSKEPNYFEPTYYYQAHYQALADFINHVSKGRIPPVSGTEGLRTIELAEGIYESSGGDYGL